VIWVFGRHVAVQTMTLLLLFILVLLVLPDRLNTLASPSEPTAFDGPAELPRTYVESSLRATPAPGKTLEVRAGEDPSQALSKASCGDTIRLQAGATFGALLLPPKKCDDSQWIIIRTSAPDSKLPPEGTRLTPCYAGISALPGRPALRCGSTENVLAKIEFNGRGGSGPVILAPGANHYRLIGLEVTRAVSPAVVYGLIGPKGIADHLIFDRMWLHGTPHDETVRGIMLSHLRYVAIVDSYFSDFHCVAKTGACVDSQAIAGGLGDDPMGPFKVVNNFLEAAAENLLMGGGESTVPPTDIEIRGNYLFKPMTWMQAQPGFVGGADGNPFIVKNLFELKHAQRVLFEDNILENTWGGFSQVGFAILLTPKNQAGAGGSNLCPDCQVTDVTIRNLVIRHVGAGLEIANGVSANGGAAKDGGRYSIHDIVLDDVQPGLYNGSGAFAQISMTPGISASPRLHDVRIDHVTALAPQTLFIIGGPRSDPRMSGLSITNSIFTAGNKPLVTTGGGVDRNCSAVPGSKTAETVLRECFSSYSFHHNVIIGADPGWPKDNKIVKSVAEVGFSDYKDGNQGNYRLSPHSKFKRAAADQKDVGADVDAIEQATSGVQ
jgi:hypothetical protein